MKKFFSYLMLVIAAAFYSVHLFSDTDSAAVRKSVILQFITYNGFGNNLYIDNVITGKRRNFDIAITSVNNIDKDTTFLPGTSEKIINPSVTVTNIGLTPSSVKFAIFAEIPELGYTATDSVPVINSGQSYTVNFDSIIIPAGQKFRLTAYINLPADSNKVNDTLIQNSIFLTGSPSNILIEEFTSSTSPSCGMNNIYLDTFITNNFSSICPIKYHVGFPPPGIDSMYIQDSNYVNIRRNYYYANTVPLAVMNGTKRVLVPYYVDSNLVDPYNSIFERGSVVSVNVANVQPSPDTIVSTVTINFLYPSHSNKLRLRAAAVERLVSYAEPIGASGEKNFYDVYRKSLTDTTGILINGNTGTQEFVFRYYKNPAWADSMLYTVAFIQDDNSRHVLNCGKSAMTPVFNKNVSFRKTQVSKPDSDKSRFRQTHNRFGFSPMNADTVSYLNFENFEGPFPPVGWTVTNPDGFYSFEKVESVNGVTLGGNSSVIMPFYWYNNSGQRDTLLSVMLDSVSSSDTLSFDYAYAVYLSNFVDSLIVNISVDGGLTFTNIFSKGGFELATAQSTTLPFIPYTSEQWETVRYPMSIVIPDNPNNVIPGNFELMQNYPNPFNPATKINYSVPRESFVTIKVYDMLGREIAQLVNENKRAGTYSVEFIAKNLSSGVYFYSLKSDDFYAVKKMVVVK
ncbi:MAG: T9SS type A sorting domain-containing protein [Ignavibacteria bacterium]|nr:T9SS type A sorting domain-containing protein [Ignavibacteria bacterium]